MRTFAILYVTLLGCALIHAASIDLKRSAEHQDSQRQKRATCPDGYYAAPGNTTCSPCDAGKNMVTNANQSACTCAPGYAVSTYFTDDGPHCSCVRCPANQVPNTDKSACAACSASLVPDAAQTACVTCPSGQIPNANQAACDVCVNGYSSAAGTSICTQETNYAGTTFGQCPPGTFQASTSTTTSLSCVQCPTGTYSTMVGATSASACVKCAAGTSSAAIGAVNENTCAFCIAGYHSGAGASTCTACFAGTYQAASGQATCDTCAAGTYAAGTGSTACSQCAADSYSEIHATSCKPCDTANNLIPNANKSGCVCAPGYAVQTEYRADGPHCSCMLSATAPATTPAPRTCEAGQYPAVGGCTECAPGSCSAAGITACIPRNKKCDGYNYPCMEYDVDVLLYLWANAHNYAPPVCTSPATTPAPPNCPAGKYPAAGGCTECAPGSCSAAGMTACIPSTQECHYVANVVDNYPCMDWGDYGDFYRIAIEDSKPAVCTS